MIKFILATAWICAATLGAVVYAFQSAGPTTEAEAQPATMLGGLDYVKTEVISVPLIHDGAVDGYFLGRLVYTVDPAEMKKLTVPAEALITDVVYSFVYSSPVLDFRKVKTLDLDAFRSGIRDGINKRVGHDLVQDVLIEQVEYLTKEEIRDNALKRHGPDAGRVLSFGSKDTEHAPEEAAPSH